MNRPSHLQVDAHRGQDRSIWVLWLVASLLGGLFGGAFVLMQTGLGLRLPPPLTQLLVWFIGGGIAGLVAGLPMWRILRRVLPEPGWWVLITALSSGLAWAVAHPIALVLVRMLPSGLRFDPTFPWSQVTRLLIALCIPALVNVVVGVAQWGVLRRYVAGAQRWLAGSIVGAILACPLAIILAGIASMPSVRPVFQLLNYNWGEWMVFYLAGAICSGASGSMVMMRLLRDRRVATEHAASGKTTSGTTRWRAFQRV